MNVRSDDLLAPSQIGPELVEIVGRGVDGLGGDEPDVRFTAWAGTGFDPAHPQHRKASDGLRYAIAIQQARDLGDFKRADAACDQVKKIGYDVGKARDRTVLVPSGRLLRGKAQGRVHHGRVPGGEGGGQ